MYQSEMQVPHFNVLMLDLETVLYLLMSTNAAEGALTILPRCRVESYIALYSLIQICCSALQHQHCQMLASLTSIPCE